LEFFRSPTDNNYRWFNSEPVGTFTRYAIYYNTSNGEYVFHIDGNIVDAWTGPFNPDRYWMFGETHDWADQMPGGTNTHEVFKEAYYYTGSSLNQHTQTAPITISSNKPVQWGATNPSAGRYEIWDKVCTN
jgi:hypothetical protein